MTTFLKMHGLGNDFVVVDARDGARPLSSAQVRAVADRRTGVGCDQFITLLPPTSADGDVFMRIQNADGGEVEACGNATRCVAHLVIDGTDREDARIDTVAGQLVARRVGPLMYAVDMGAPRLDWRQIPLAEAVDSLHLPVSLEGLSDPVGVSMGNPHAVFFVADAEAVDLPRLGPIIEHHPLFPNRVNAEMVSVLGEGRLRMRVWERGAGITQACGTGACATMVAAVRRGLVRDKAEIVLDGGSLFIEWAGESMGGDSHVIMTGPVATAFSGVLDPSLLEAGE